MNLSNKFFDIPDFDFEGEKKKFIENLDFLKSMSVQEQTLYKKWQEFNKDDYGIRRKASKFASLHHRLWKPTDITNKELTIKEIESINPVVRYVPSEGASEWTLYRMLIHTMDWSANPGRNQKYIITDKTTDKVLGLVSLGSDVTSIKVRDDYIGWSKDNKFVDHKLNNTAIASTIVCTTTSLYGVHSQYNGIPHWKTLGESAGKIAIKPDDSVYFVWADWLKENHREEFDKAQSQTGPKQNTINRIFRHLDIKTKDYEHGFHRGVFFANMYDNGLEYLRNEIKDKDLVMKPKFENNIDYIMNWWKPKAIRRYVKLYDDNRIKPEVLFYGDIVGKTWEETKQQYIGEVGR